jgi:hypothetical protein
MATTTNYSWTTPDDTALVKDGASAIRSLGTAIDTTTYNNSLLPIVKTIVDAKGDIIAATAADTVSRLAVGANDTVLTADSTAGTGLKWATPSSGGMTLISTTTLTGASVTLSSIPATYNHLQIVIRNHRPSGNNENIRFRFNSDTGANRHAWYNTQGDTGNSAAFTDTSSLLNTSQNNGASTALTVIDFIDYANTTTWKVGYAKTFANENATITSFQQRQVQFMGYNQTGAISSLQLVDTGAGFTSGTVLLYGVK